MSYSIELYGPGIEGMIATEAISGPFLTIDEAEAKAKSLGDPGPGRIELWPGLPPRGYRILDEHRTVVRSGAFRTA
jgi:hypothetical protein